MAEFATPSAVAIATSEAPVTTTTEHKRPEKPDEELFQKELKQRQKEHADAMAKFVRGFFRIRPFIVIFPHKTNTSI